MARTGQLNFIQHILMKQHHYEAAVELRDAHPGINRQIGTLYILAKNAKGLDNLQEGLSKWSTPWSAATSRRFGLRRVDVARFR